MANQKIAAKRHTAIVHAADGVRFISTASDGAALAQRLADYVEGRCDDTLWPDAAAKVRALIDADNPYAAIAMYFDNVGQRWDAERLELI